MNPGSGWCRIGLCGRTRQCCCQNNTQPDFRTWLTLKETVSWPVLSVFVGVRCVFENGRQKSTLGPLWFRDHFCSLQTAHDIDQGCAVQSGFFFFFFFCCIWQILRVRVWVSEGTITNKRRHVLGRSRKYSGLIKWNPAVFTLTVQLNKKLVISLLKKQVLGRVTIDRLKQLQILSRANSWLRTKLQKRERQQTEEYSKFVHCYFCCDLFTLSYARPELVFGASELVFSEFVCGGSGDPPRFSSLSWDPVTARHWGCRRPRSLDTWSRIHVPAEPSLPGCAQSCSVPQYFWSEIRRKHLNTAHILLHWSRGLTVDSEGGITPTGPYGLMTLLFVAMSSPLHQMWSHDLCMAARPRR